MNDITVSFIAGNQAIVNCRLHGRSIVKKERAQRALGQRENPCPECGNAKNPSQEATKGGDKYARRNAGWRKLDGRGLWLLEDGDATEQRPHHLERVCGGDHLAGGAKRGDGGADSHIYFPNRMEANCFRILLYQKNVGAITGFEHQPEPFDYREWYREGVVSYKPDFKVSGAAAGTASGTTLGVYWIETKGHMDTKSLTKLRRLAKHYPEAVLRVITSAKVIRAHSSGFPPHWQWDNWLELRQRWKSLCPGWEGA